MTRPPRQAVRVANKKSIRPHCTLKEFSIADGGCGECSSEELWSLLYETSAITGASRLAMQGCSSTRRWVWLAVMLQPSKLEFEAGGGVVCYSEKRLAVPKDLLPLLACSKGPAALPGVRVDCEHGRVCVAMVLLARGALDAAHDMVGDQDSPEATYVYAMIHRREGGAKGEAGLSGFSNSRRGIGSGTSGIISYSRSYWRRRQRCPGRQPRCCRWRSGGTGTAGRWLVCARKRPRTRRTRYSASFAGRCSWRSGYCCLTSALSWQLLEGCYIRR